LVSHGLLLMSWLTVIEVRDVLCGRH